MSLRSLRSAPRQSVQVGVVPLWPKSAVRIGFGVIWAIDAAFKWRPGFHKDFIELIAEAGRGQPRWLHWWFRFWAETITSHPQVWAYAIATIETLIAAALILGFARKITYLAATITALGIWSVAEGFGGPYTASSTDIGAAVMYAVVAVALLVLSLQCGPSRYSIDYVIERRVRWWHWLAEVGARNHPPTRPSEPAVSQPEQPGNPFPL